MPLFAAVISTHCFIPVELGIYVALSDLASTFCAMDKGVGGVRLFVGRDGEFDIILPKHEGKFEK